MPSLEATATQLQLQQYAENRGPGMETIDMIVVMVHSRDIALEDLTETETRFDKVCLARDWAAHTAKWHPHGHKRTLYSALTAEHVEEMKHLQETWVSTNERIEHCNQILSTWDRDLSEIDSHMDHLAAEEIAAEEDTTEACEHDFYEDAYYVSEFAGRDVTVSPEQFTMVLADPCNEVMCMTVGFKGSNFSAITRASNVSIIWHERSSGIIYIRSHEANARRHAARLICKMMKKNRAIVDAR
tara:strand:- start:435 stop:1163 length:729 start_codon:yes stop_codon:yes gene_type:complete